MAFFFEVWLKKEEEVEPERAPGPPPGAGAPWSSSSNWGPRRKRRLNLNLRLGRFRAHVRYGFLHPSGARYDIKGGSGIVFILSWFSGCPFFRVWKKKNKTK